MRPHPVLLAIPVAWVFACGDATQPTPPQVAPPVFQTLFSDDVPAGAAAWTACTEADYNYVIDPHFDSLVSTFADPDTAFTDQCGDLDFDNRTRSVTTVYSIIPGSPSEAPGSTGGGGPGWPMTARGCGRKSGR